MSPGRWLPSLVMDVQVLITHASRVTIMAREIGHPPRIIRGPDLCDLFQARDEARLSGLVDRWASSGLAAQVVQIPPVGEASFHDRPPTPSSCQTQAGRDPSTPTTGLIRRSDPHMARPPTGETRMGPTTDHVYEGHDQTAPASPDARRSDGTMDAPPEPEASFEEIER
jgi:hypothetical protein